MNERLREFVRESNLDVYGLGKERYKWEYTVEKFAEMIINDCADIAHQAEPYASGDLIRQHFALAKNQ